MMFKGGKIPPDIADMDYISPIRVDADIKTTIDNVIYKAVIDTGIEVDKDDLIKALHYDRQQYEKGYVDGYDAALESIRRKMKRGAKDANS
jgi:hypothetical protein